MTRVRLIIRWQVHWVLNLFQTTALKNKIIVSFDQLLSVQSQQVLAGGTGRLGYCETLCWVKGSSVGLVVFVGGSLCSGIRAPGLQHILLVTSS